MKETSFRRRSFNPLYLLGISLLNHQPLFPENEMNDLHLHTLQVLADIGEVIFSRFGIKEMGARDVTEFFLDGQEPSQTAHVMG